jgi:hypothetical protein
MMMMGGGSGAVLGVAGVVGVVEMVIAVVVVAADDGDYGGGFQTAALSGLTVFDTVGIKLG